MPSIIAMIERGEGKNLEFKQALPAGEKLAKSIIAFANMFGGKIVIGVDDQRNIIGLANAEIPATMDSIANIVHDSIQPVLVPTVYPQAVGDKTVVIIEVPASQMKPHYVKSIGKMNGTYIRVGATNKQADAEYIQELERQRLNIGYDEDWLLDPDIAIDPNELRSILSTNLHKPVAEKDLQNLRLCRLQEGTCRFTNAAAILAGAFEHVRIKCARFKGNDTRVFIDRKEYTGDLFSQVEHTMQFLLNHINLHGEIGPDYIRRVDKYEVPTDAMREAVLNAVIHRDYSMQGSDIKVAVFDSRIEIVSPGSFPKGITVDDVISGRSEVRNRIIARIFHESGAIEQWGRGVQLILRLCDEAGLPVPAIEESGMFVRLTLYRPVNAKVDEGTKVDEKVDEGTNRSSCPFGLDDWFANHESINIREAMELFGLSKSGANKRLNALVSDNLLEMQGKGKGARYVPKRPST